MTVEVLKNFLQILKGDKELIQRLLEIKTGECFVVLRREK